MKLTAAERQWLALSLPSEMRWPPSDEAMSLLGQIPGYQHEVAGGPRLRVLLLASLDIEGETELPLEAPEFWLLDSLLVRSDLRAGKLPDGTPLLALAKKVWALLLDVHDEQLPPEWRRKETEDAGDHHPDEDDAARAVHEAASILRSGNGERTGDALPPTEA